MKWPNIDARRGWLITLIVSLALSIIGMVTLIILTDDHECDSNISNWLIITDIYSGITAAILIPVNIFIPERLLYLPLLIALATDIVTVHLAVIGEVFLFVTDRTCMPKLLWIISFMTAEFMWYHVFYKACYYGVILSGPPTDPWLYSEYEPSRESQEGHQTDHANPLFDGGHPADQTASVNV